jgi:hypothetical protein
VDVNSCETKYTNVVVIYSGNSNNRQDDTDKLDSFVLTENSVFVYYTNEHYDSLAPTTHQNTRNNSKSAYLPFIWNP